MVLLFGLIEEKPIKSCSFQVWNWDEFGSPFPEDGLDGFVVIPNLSDVVLLYISR